MVLISNKLKNFIWLC